MLYKDKKNTKKSLILIEEEIGVFEKGLKHGWDMRWGAGKVCSWEVSGKLDWGQF